MTALKKTKGLIPVFISLFLFASPAYAAAPDGVGPWADSVQSFSQGIMKNGNPVPAARSDTTASLGVAEGDTVDTHFFSLGFGGNISLGFVNGIQSGVLVVESTNPGYPGETAKVELSQDGVTWIMAGTVVQDGQVNVPEQLDCAKYARITDISNAAIMPDDIADGYDVDGVKATGEPCGQPSPSPTGSVTPTPTGTLTPTPSATPSANVPNVSEPNASDPNAVPGTTVTTAAPQIVPGFPNTGGGEGNNQIIPKLPNTGVGPDANPWSLSGGIQFIVSLVSKALGFK